MSLEPGPEADGDLATEMRAHRAERFPASIRKGEDYGEVDPVMISADVFGWALGVSRGIPLSVASRLNLRRAADRLEHSMTAFPTDARPYFERVRRLARLTLEHHE